VSLPCNPLRALTRGAPSRPLPRIYQCSVWMLPPQNLFWMQQAVVSLEASSFWESTITATPWRSSATPSGLESCKDNTNAKTSASNTFGFSWLTRDASASLSVGQQWVVAAREDLVDLVVPCLGQVVAEDGAANPWVNVPQGHQCMYRWHRGSPPRRSKASRPWLPQLFAPAKRASYPPPTSSSQRARRSDIATPLGWAARLHYN